MEAALVLVFLENMVQFGFEFAHRNISRFGLTRGRLAHKGEKTQGCYFYLNPFRPDGALEILIAGISESNGVSPCKIAEFPFPAAPEIFIAFSLSAFEMKLLK
jgi:hypothetical protein